LITGSCDYDLLSLCLARVTSTGHLDNTFGYGGGMAKLRLSGFQFPGGVTPVAVRQDGKVLLSASCTQDFALGIYEVCIVRLLENGDIDPTFGSRSTPGWFISSYGGFVGVGRVMSVDNQQRILLAGACSENGSNSLFCAVRLTADGLADESYGQSAFPGLAFVPTSLHISGNPAAALQVDGALVIAGTCKEKGNPLDNGQFCVARLLANGSIDTTFGANGAGYVGSAVRGYIDHANAVASQRDGGVVVAGYCNAPIGSSTTHAIDFCAARFTGPHASASCALNVDGNGLTQADSDTLLIIRYLLGFRGDALTTGAVGRNPTRTGQTLENYLATLDLDADGDGQALAMTDGLLILRAMLGLTGTALTQGATNASHPNVRNAQQILTWIESTHGVACLP
jgi:uncharacterized delta-60 repeat protein